MTRAREILEWNSALNEVDPFTATAIGLGGAALGAGALKTKQAIQKARKEHGTVRHAAYLKSRALGAKGLRKGAQKSSAQIYKLAKKLETPKPRKVERKKKNEDVQQGWKDTKGGVAQTARGVGEIAKSATKGIGGAIKRDWQKTKERHQQRRQLSTERSHARKLGKIQRRKEKLQAKHDLKLHKKRLSADIKHFKYDPSVL